MNVEIEQHDRVTVVTINRPAARNAVDSQTAEELLDAFIEFDVDSDST